MPPVRSIGIIEGAEELARTLRVFMEFADSDAAYNVMRDAAVIVRDEVKRTAPGSLRDWVRAGRMPKKKPGRPAAWVMLAPPGGRGGMSPLGQAFGQVYGAHRWKDVWAFPYVVEYGTALRRFAEYRMTKAGYRHALRFTIQGGRQVLYRYWVAKMPKKPFFRRAYDASKERASQAIFDGTSKLVDKLWQTGKL